MIKAVSAPRYKHGFTFRYGRVVPLTRFGRPDGRYIFPPERVEQRRRETQRQWDDPEIRARREEANRVAWNRPGRKERISEIMKEVSALPETKEYKSKSALARHADPNDRFSNPPRPTQFHYNGLVFDSKHEWRNYIKLCRNPNVLLVEKIRRGDPRHNHPLPGGGSYHPDFYVIYRDGFDEYIESKPYGTIEENEAHELKHYGRCNLREKLETHPGVRLMSG